MDEDGWIIKWDDNYVYEYRNSKNNLNGGIWKMSTDSMHRYSQHIHSNSHDVVGFVVEHLGEIAVKRLVEIFNLVKAIDVNTYIEENISLIMEFISKTNSQRPGFFKKITKSKEELPLDSKLMFLVCTLVSLERAKIVIDARDNYRRAFSPGASYREAAADAALASVDLMRIGSYVQFPYEVFDNLGIDYENTEEEDQD